MLPAKYRLTKPIDFRRVHAEGRCWSDRMVVLCKRANGLPVSRFGFSVSRRVGMAVTRNRTKRLLREAVRSHCVDVPSGWDIVLIARKGIIGVDFWAVERSVTQLLRLAQLFRVQGDATPDEME